MADTDDTTNGGPSRNLQEGLSAETPPDQSTSHFRPPARNALEAAIEAERTQLLQAHSVLVCLYKVLLRADGDDAVIYAEAAHVAAHLIDDAVERLDLVNLRPLIEPVQRRRKDPGNEGSTEDMVREEGCLT